MNLGLPDSRIRELFEFIDADGSGSIDVQEFVRGIFPCAYDDLFGAGAEVAGQESIDLAQRLQDEIARRQTVRQQAQ